MKIRRGLTRKKSIFFHGLQQLAAFVAVTYTVMMIAYSFTSVPVNNKNYPSGRIQYDWNLFAAEDSFDETSTFDYMLLDSLQEIIRYNVAKSQLEVDGSFDGNKLIDINAFANRKNDLVTGQDTSSLETVMQYDIKTAEYYLKDLLKWAKYGIDYETVTFTVDDFVQYFDDDIYKEYRTYLTQEEWEILTAYGGTRMRDLIQLSFAAYGYEMMDSDITQVIAETHAEVQDSNAGLYTFVDESEAQYDSPQEGAEVYNLDIIYAPWVYVLLANILLSDNCMVSALNVNNENGEVTVTVFMLQERYTPADGETLAECADSWKNYWRLAVQVQQAAEDLSYNYNEYLAFKERYGAGNTNIAYTFEMTMMGEQIRVSNIEDTGVWDLDIYYKTHYGKYLIYRPQSMTFESNTGIIQETDLFEAFSNYEYAYPETAQIWLAVDTTYPVSDHFAQASAAYAFLHPSAYLVLSLGIVGAIIWFVLFLFLNVSTGYRKENKDEEAQLILNWFDAIPTEAALALGGGIAAGILFAAYHIVFDKTASKVAYICSNRMKVSLLAGLAGMLISALFCLFWYSLVRRIKGHTLWKNSVAKWLWQDIIKKGWQAVKKPLFRMYDNSGVLIRCIFIPGAIMLVNLGMGVFLYRFWIYGRTRELLLLILLGILLVDGVTCYLWFWNHVKRKKIVEGIARIRDGELHYQVDTESMHGENLQLAEAVNSIGAGIKSAVETSMKDERLKADLITNVSHDIKTPLTSIINYVDLLKREKIETEPVKGYIDVLESKSQRLKQLTDDLLEASKISSGNITLIMEKINLTELICQSLGEFSEKFEEKRLTVMEGYTKDAVFIEADSRRIWRVIENLFNNICKYALANTRVYLDMALLDDGKKVMLSVKNISAQPLNIQAEELTERFIRGDVSRSTEGSGLGLSIAKNLTELQNGKFEIYLDGDLFKVTLTFPIYEEKEEEERERE